MSGTGSDKIILLSASPFAFTLYISGSKFFPEKAVNNSMLLEEEVTAVCVLTKFISL